MAVSIDPATALAQCYEHYDLTRASIAQGEFEHFSLSANYELAREANFFEELPESHYPWQTNFGDILSRAESCARS